MEKSRLDGLVSVITPVYNCADVISITVDAVASQTISVCEHILIDDGSTDGTLTIIEALAKKYDHLVILRQGNSGAGVARNLGITGAKGKYIAFLDGDDCWSAGKLEAQIGFMEYQNILFSYGAYNEIDSESGEFIAHSDPPSELTHTQLLNGCPIGCLTVAYNQQVLGKRFMPSARRGQDWGLWLSITRSGVIAYKYPGNFAFYNRSPNSLSKNKISKLFDVYGIYRNQENLGVLAAILCLTRHTFYVIKKQKAKNGS
jgi:teichuronic acid biosynthesis glycosyltransferase TuaG